MAWDLNLVPQLEPVIFNSSGNICSFKRVGAPYLLIFSESTKYLYSPKEQI